MENFTHYIIANKNKSIFVFLVILSIVAIGLKVGLPNSACGKYYTKTISFGEKKLIVEVADSDCKRMLGLSGRSSIRDEEGMLFDFENTGEHGFWMKGMQFPIDILWLDDNLKIVNIEKSLTPSTFPKIYGKNFISKYVLEVRSGLVDEIGIKVGNIISIDKK